MRVRITLSKRGPSTMQEFFREVGEERREHGELRALMDALSRLPRTRAPDDEPTEPSR